MRSAMERDRLIERYAAEASCPGAAVLRCAAGIVILVAVVAGPWLVVTAGGAGEGPPAPPRPAAALPDSPAERGPLAGEHRERILEAPASETAPVNRDEAREEQLRVF
ncbi:MAG: hypothetical protein IT529_10850 [Burkholderiales bacterium]|nr:hypothetical protein [Burkholderiales bacterium]